MGDAHCGVGGVHRLAAGATRTVDVDLEIVLADFDLFGLIHLGKHEHAGRRGVDASLRLGRWHPLHPVHAALVLEVCPHALGRIGGAALDGELDILDAAEIARGLLDDLGIPLLGFRVVQVHAKQVAREERGLGPALPHLDLHDHIATVIRVARNEQSTQAFFHDVELGLDVRKLLRERLIIGSHLGRSREVVGEGDPAVVGVDDATQLGVATVNLLRPGRVGVELRVCQLLLEFLMLGQQCLH